MSANSKTKPRNMTYDNLVNFVRKHDQPCVTAGEVATEFGVTNSAANYRLKKLKEKGRIQDKQVGASAKVWYPIG